MPHDLRVIMYDVMVAGALRHFLREGTIDTEQLALYRNHGHYVSAVVHTDRANRGARSEGGGGRPRRSPSRRVPRTRKRELADQFLEPAVLADWIEV